MVLMVGTAGKWFFTSGTNGTNGTTGTAGGNFFKNIWFKWN